MTSSRKHAQISSAMGGVIALSAILLLFGIASPPISSHAQEEQQQQQQTTTGTAGSQMFFAIQNTSRSIPDPTPGHEDAHQVVTALPLREDGKIYRGTVTFSASQPIEVVVLHPFISSNQTVGGSNATSTMPLILEDQNTAITLMHEGEGRIFDSVNFVGSSLVFHGRNPMNFTVSYTIVGDLVEPTPLPPAAAQ